MSVEGHEFIGKDATIRRLSKVGVVVVVLRCSLSTITALKVIISLPSHKSHEICDLLPRAAELLGHNICDLLQTTKFLRIR